MTMIRPFYDNGFALTEAKKDSVFLICSFHNCSVITNRDL